MNLIEHEDGAWEASYTTPDGKVFTSGKCDSAPRAASNALHLGMSHAIELAKDVADRFHETMQTLEDQGMKPYHKAQMWSQLDWEKSRLKREVD